MKKNWDTVELLRHARHDWLNKLQLIKGNLSLNRVERAQEIINEIVVETQNETKLTNLKLPQFASMLLTHNWENYSFQLEFEVIDEIKIAPLNENDLIAWFEVFFACLHRAAKPFMQNTLFITIETRRDGIRFFFDFNGIIDNKEEIQGFLQNMPKGFVIHQHVLEEKELMAEMYWHMLESSETQLKNHETL